MALLSALVGRPALPPSLSALLAATVHSACLVAPAVIVRAAVRVGCKSHSAGSGTAC
jgi:hypothetical protein